MKRKDFFVVILLKELIQDKKNLLKNTVKIVGSNSPKALDIMKEFIKELLKLNGLHQPY